MLITTTSFTLDGVVWPRGVHPALYGLVLSSSLANALAKNPVIRPAHDDAHIPSEIGVCPPVGGLYSGGLMLTFALAARLIKTGIEQKKAAGSTRLAVGRLIVDYTTFH